MQRAYERRDVEIKGPGPSSDKHLFAKIARAALGMGNLRDGGYVVIGIDDKRQTAMLPGLTEVDLASWLNYDNVADGLARFSDPPLRFDVAKRSLSSGAEVALLRVEEFEDVPHLCTRDSGLDTTRRGALYIRSRKSPATTEIALSSELRDILSLSTQKALRDFVQTAGRAGLTVSERQAGADSYLERLDRAWDRPGRDVEVIRSVDKVRSRGHWEIHVRPAVFEPDRVPYRELEETLTSAAVRLRGWPMPFIDYGRDMLRGTDWIGNDIDEPPTGRYETWRFLTDGEFAQLTAVAADWGHKFVGGEVPKGFASVVTVVETVFLMTEVYELAARLALGAAGADPMRVEVRLHNLAGRALIPGQVGRTFMLPYKAPQGESVGQVGVYPRDELVGSASALAVSACEDFFARFGWQPNRWEIEAVQNQLKQA
ncbi:MAG: putative DNA binding domain-containing protein [Actinobacteria bacterium]|nr:putative DNA binding domain-containing protein [Actinomycetota bacterium]